jgi:K+-sensing histidine kinase KdpD
MANIIEKINKIAVKFLQPLTPEETYILIIKEAKKLVGAEYGSIYLQQNGDLEKVYSSLPLLYKIKARKRGYTYKAFKERKSFVVDIEKVLKIHPRLKNLGIKSTIYMPLYYRNKSIGALSLDSMSNAHFTDEELDVLKLFGSMASLAIKKTQLYNEVKQALEVRDQFISLASHELRTPLTSVNGYIQMLYNSELAKKNTNEGLWLRNLYSESIRLTKLVSELLNINRVRGGKLEYIFKKVHMIEIVERAMSAVNFIHTNHNFFFSNSLQHSNDIIVGDYDKLVQVVSNLLDNAAKFSPNESRIGINLKVIDSSINLSIEDQGDGINKKDISKVFEVFYKGDHQKQGMGLGLYLCNDIIRHHQGIIEIDSRRTKGTKVIISLPRAKI